MARLKSCPSRFVVGNFDAAGDDGGGRGILRRAKIARLRMTGVRVANPCHGQPEVGGGRFNAQKELQAMSNKLREKPRRAAPRGQPRAAVPTCFICDKCAGFRQGQSVFLPSLWDLVPCY